jgi:hypothetical protein
MSSTWQSMCVASAQRSPYEFDLINFLTTGILVCFFVVTGYACSRRCLQWRSLPSAAKRDLWELYGTFCFMGGLGCAAGIVAFVCLLLGNMCPPSHHLHASSLGSVTSLARSAYRTARAQLLTKKYFLNLSHFEIMCARAKGCQCCGAWWWW